MNIVRAFRSGNTIRITLPRAVRHALSLTPGDYLRFEHVAEGKLELINASRPVKTKTGRKKRTATHGG